MRVVNSDEALIFAVTRAAAVERLRKNFVVRSRKNNGGVFTVSVSQYQSESDSPGQIKV